MGIGTWPSKLSIPVGAVAASAVPDGRRREVGTRTPHSQLRQLSLGCLLSRSFTRRPLAVSHRIVSCDGRRSPSSWQGVQRPWENKVLTRRFPRGWHYRRTPTPEHVCRRRPRKAAEVWRREASMLVNGQALLLLST